MGNIKNAGIWGVHPKPYCPCEVLGVIRCKGSIDLRSDSSTASERVNIVTNGQRVIFTGRRLVNGEVWYQTVKGDWLFALYVVMDDRPLPFV